MGIIYIIILLEKIRNIYPKQVKMNLTEIQFSDIGGKTRLPWTRWNRWPPFWEYYAMFKYNTFSFLYTGYHIMSTDASIPFFFIHNW